MELPDLAAPKRKADNTVGLNPFSESLVLVNKNNEKKDNTKNKQVADEKCTILSQPLPLFGKIATPRANTHARYPAMLSIFS
jgi:hypothetical protein